MGGDSLRLFVGSKIWNALSEWRELSSVINSKGGTSFIVEYSSRLKFVLL